MFKFPELNAVLVSFGLVALAGMCKVGAFASENDAVAAHNSTSIVASKTITVDALRKYAQKTVEADEDGAKVKYTGVPLRVLLAEMLPDTKLDSMPEWKALTKRELVVELKGKDGFPSLVTATEIAINKSGDKFVVAIEKDGKAFDVAPKLICKSDEAKTRCVRDIATLKVISVER